MTKKKIHYIRRVFFIIVGLSMAYSQIHYVELTHPVYRVIDFYQASGMIKIFEYQKPYTRNQIRQWLEVANEIVGDNLLTDRYLNEFSDHDRHVVSFGNDRYHFTGDAELRWLSQSFQGARPYHKIDIGGNVRGHVGTSLSYQADIATIVYMGNLDIKKGYDMDPNLVPIKHHHFKSTYEGDIGITQLIAETDWGYLSFGSDLFRWGPGRSGNLLVDLRTFPLTNIHGVTRFGPFRYTQVVGVLNNLYPHTIGEGKRYLADKRKLSLHRLDVQLLRFLSLGVSEAVVYNHDFSMSYINPLQPFAISEVYGGDSDNNLAAIDMTIKATSHTKTYLELMADDLDFMQDWFKAYVNKWAVLFGQQWANPFHWESTLFTFEAIRVEPYVFTHRDTANHYEYYGQSIGYDLEPNSLRYFAELEWFQSNNLWHTMTIMSTRHGDGDRIFGNPAEDQREKKFLQGTVEHRIQFDYTLEYEFFENMWVSLRLYYLFMQNEKIDNKYSEYNGDRISKGVSISIDLNY